MLFTGGRNTLLFGAPFRLQRQTGVVERKNGRGEGDGCWRTWTYRLFMYGS